MTLRITVAMTHDGRTRTSRTAVGPTILVALATARITGREPAY